MHLTGHGLRKIMRARAGVTYRITALPAVPAELAFLAAQAAMPAAEAYGTWNMGAGFGLTCPPAPGWSWIAPAALATTRCSPARPSQDRGA
jgi:phosphoribosylformylglycinamidine cyclo-ligase